MKSSSVIVSLLPLLAASQNVTVPTTCDPPYTQVADEALYTVPYPYASVLSIIGSYQNLTWSGSPDGSVTLNGSDNTVGTARTYDLAGAHVIETILTYDSPPGGPYYENHNVALLTVPRSDADGGNVTLYFPTDATTVTSVCGGLATSFNFTAIMCANNATAAQQLIHLLHTSDAMTVGLFLGGANFTTCDALTASATSTGAPVATFVGAASKLTNVGGFVGLAGAALAMVL